MNFRSLFDAYIKSTQFRDLSVRSKQLYMYYGDKMAAYFRDTPVRGIKRSMLLKYIDDHADHPAQTNLAIRVVSVVFGYAVNMEHVDFNPASKIKKLKIGSHTKWTPGEVKAVIALHDRKVSTAVAIAWYTGQRESDILGMRWRDYDGEYISVRQQKTGLEMKIKAHKDLVSLLAAIKGEPDDFIVSGKKRMSGAAFRNMLKRRTHKLNIEKVFHGIRKGVASSLAENGRSMSEIAAILGHKSIRMAAYYAEQADNKRLTDTAVDSLTSCV